MNPFQLLTDILHGFVEEDIWENSPVESYRYLGNTNRGEVGEEFVRQFLTNHGFKVSNGNRTSKTDITIDEIPTEVKTASLGVNRTFQFNHVRLDRAYSILLVIGICPNEIVFGAWTKSDVEDGWAGRLVPMAQDQRTTFKLTKRFDSLRPIEELPGRIRSVSTGLK